MNDRALVTMVAGQYAYRFSVNRAVLGCSFVVLGRMPDSRSGGSQDEHDSVEASPFRRFRVSNREAWSQDTLSHFQYT
jgi:hypothetical protein